MEIKIYAEKHKEKIIEIFKDMGISPNSYIPSLDVLEELLFGKLSNRVYNNMWEGCGEYGLSPTFLFFPKTKYSVLERTIGETIRKHLKLKNGY